MRQVIAVLNQKGGVGKTTTAVNVGAYLAKSGKSVLIVDFDPQGNATSGLGIDKNQLELTSYDLLFGKTTADKAIRESIIYVSCRPTPTWRQRKSSWCLRTSGSIY
jgi:chromosome partitioning protein